ncbi:MAG: hypothetical protein ACREET_11345 [Stellaceae bacterium]
MNISTIEKISVQAAGAFGEKAVEAELLRHNWIPANINQTVKNAAKYDIYAMKGDHWVGIQVKTCRPGMPAFLYGGFAPGMPITTTDIVASDFTIIVRMGKQRQDDRFYIVPTTEVRKEIADRQREHKERGTNDIGMWRLGFADRKDGRPEAGAGIERKWEQYEGAWNLLDDSAHRPQL